MDMSHLDLPALRRCVVFMSLLVFALLAFACGESEEEEPAPDDVVAVPEAVETQDNTNGSSVQAPPGFVHLPSAAFSMGNSGGFQDAVNEGPVHLVDISQLFMAVNEVTQAEYMQHMDNNPSRFKGDQRPVESVTWFEAVEYCNRRSEAEGLTSAYHINGTAVTWLPEGKGYRLPTEAEWEYGCRAGSNSDLFNGDLTTPAYDCNNTDPMLDRVAWYCANSGDSTHNVGQKQANGFGLKGMHGNVAEWVWDWFAVYPGIDRKDPTGPEHGKNRTVRGGAYKFPAAECRSSRRIPLAPDMFGYRRSTIGFRVVRPVH